MLGLADALVHCTSPQHLYTPPRQGSNEPTLFKPGQQRLCWFSQQRAACSMLRSLLHVAPAGAPAARCAASRGPRTLPPHLLPPVPATTAAAVQTACPTGHRSVARRAACGTRAHAPLLAALAP